MCKWRLSLRTGNNQQTTTYSPKMVGLSQSSMACDWVFEGNFIKDGLILLSSFMFSLKWVSWFQFEKKEKKKKWFKQWSNERFCCLFPARYLCHGGNKAVKLTKTTHSMFSKTYMVLHRSAIMKILEGNIDVSMFLNSRCVFEFQWHRITEQNLTYSFYLIKTLLWFFKTISSISFRKGWNKNATCPEMC